MAGNLYKNYWLLNHSPPELFCSVRDQFLWLDWEQRIMIIKVVRQGLNNWAHDNLELIICIVVNGVYACHGNCVH